MQFPLLGMSSLPFSPELLLPNFPHRLPHHLLQEAVLISLACWRLLFSCGFTYVWVI